MITLPAPLLRELPITPALSAAKQNALQAISYGQQMKTQLEFQNRFWGTDDPLVRIVGEPINAIWEPTPKRRSGILTLWLSDRRARKGLSEEQRLKWAGQELSRLFPDSYEQPCRGRSISWGEEQFSKGSYSHFQLGFLTKHAEHLPRAEGRLHFAGEHTSPFCGYMEGALESGVRAALEVL